MQAGSPWIRRRRARLPTSWKRVLRSRDAGTSRGNAVSLCSRTRRRNSSRPGCIRGSLLPHFLPRILLPTLLRGLLHRGSHSHRNRTRIYHLNPSRNSRRCNLKDKDTSLRHTSPCLSNPLLSRRVRNWETRQGLLHRGLVRRNRVAVRF
jgi:hypothetical protein